MSVKTLVTGLGACAILLSGLWNPGNARANFANAFDSGATSFKQKGSPRIQSGVDLKEGFSNLLLAGRQNSIRRSIARNNSSNSNYRQTNTRKNRPHGRSNYKINRQNDSRFIQRNRRTKFFNSTSRSYSTRKRRPNNRSYVGKSDFRNSRNFFKRPGSRKFEFITPRNKAR